MNDEENDSDPSGATGTGSPTEKTVIISAGLSGLKRTVFDSGGGVKETESSAWSLWGEETPNRTEERKKEPKKKQSKDLHLCEECGLSLNSRDGLNKHRTLKHKMSQKTVCTVCGKEMRRDSYKNHVKWVHGKYTIEDSCPYCGKTGFKGKFEAEMHIKRVHEKERRYFCDQAGCQFSCYNEWIYQKHLKNVHLNVHQTCPQCGKPVKHIYHHLKHAHKDDPHLFQQYKTKTGLFQQQQTTIIPAAHNG